MRSESLSIAGLTLVMLVAPVSVSRAQGMNGGTSGGARRSISARPESVGVVRRPSIVVDGRLDDVAWLGMAAAADFVQQRPQPGSASRKSSEARVWVDGAALYVGMRLFDAEDSIVAPVARRDADVYSDWAYIYIDSYDDRRSAFHFAVNPRGVQRDAQVTNDEEWQQDFGWNAVWQAATTRDSLGWTAEFRIPLSQLRFANSSGAAAWGIQFGRHIARFNERSYWSPILPDRAGFVSQFGRLTDVRLNGASRRLELIPYTLAQMTTRTIDAGNPLARAREPLATIGADAKWSLTPDFTLTATLNPDFGQVESDPSEVNLTASESFFREQRPFFLEGAELFSVPLANTWTFGPQQLFYSRRIGRSPQLDDPDSAAYVDRPGATDLLAALKLTGKTQNGLSFGLLSATTDEMRASVVYEDGRRGRAVVEPLTQYTMGRLQKDFRNGESFVGAVATSVMRDDNASTLRRSAFVGGVDFRHHFLGRSYRLGGSLLGSNVRGTREAITETQRHSVHYFQRPDADHLQLDSTRTSLGGLSADLRLTKIGGALRWGANAHVVTAGFEANDLGFHSRSDLFETTGWVGRVFYTGPSGIRNWEAWLNYWGAWTLGGEREKVGQSLWTRAEFTNYWNAEGSIEVQHAGRAMTALRGGPALHTPQRVMGFASLTSDARRSIVARVGVNAAHDVGDAGSNVSIFSQLTQRLGDKAQIVFGPNVMWWRNPQQYVDRVGTRYIVGDVRQTTTSLTTRVDYSFTPRLSLQFYAQPFLSAGTYGRLGEVTDAHSLDPERRVTRFQPNDLTQVGDDWQVSQGGSSFLFGRPDYAFNEFRSNSVLRWEYRPGSTLFLVWSHGRSADGRAEPFSMRRQMRELTETRGDHVFLLKVSHWLGR